MTRLNMQLQINAVVSVQHDLQLSSANFTDGWWVLCQSLRKVRAFVFWAQHMFVIVQNTVASRWWMSVMVNNSTADILYRVCCSVVQGCWKQCEKCRLAGRSTYIDVCFRTSTAFIRGRGSCLSSSPISAMSCDRRRRRRRRWRSRWAGYLTHQHSVAISCIISSSSSSSWAWCQFNRRSLPTTRCSL